MRPVWVLAIAVLAPVACSSADTDSSDPTARLVLVGDVMLGRGVAPVIERDPGSVFERLRPVVADADLAMANLESPLTTRPHVRGANALEADPAAAAVLAGAGFDVLDIANNHASDAGPSTVLDTIDALDAAGLAHVGGGADATDAAAPLLIDVRGVRVGIVAFDLAGGGTATSSEAGVTPWSEASAEEAVTTLRDDVDVVVVALHGGVEYLPRPDPALDRVVAQVVGWGADVVWGHGSHVRYPVDVLGDAARPTVAAPGLGNALFDQRLPGTDMGNVLEVLVDREGVLTMRVGIVRSTAGRAEFDGWDEPAGDAVAIDGEWWTPVRPLTPLEPPPAPSSGASMPEDADVVALAAGDVTGTGVDDLVVSYRRPVTPEVLQRAFPGRTWADARGRSAHLAVLTTDGRIRWGAAVLLDPVGAIAVCTGSVALGFTELDDATPTSGAAWTWAGFGFSTSPVLAGFATPGCADIDHDGTSEPVLTDRSSTGTEAER